MRRAAWFWAVLFVSSACGEEVDPGLDGGATPDGEGGADASDVGLSDAELALDGGSIVDLGPQDAGAGMAPRWVASDPAPGEADVYPAPLGPMGGVRLVLMAQFDRPLDPSSLETWLRPDGESGRMIRGLVSAPGRLEVELSPALGARQVLADSTTYQWDLSELKGLDGAPVSLEQLGAQGLRFTTTRYDALLNHSCGHVLFGPHASATAAAQPSAAPRTDVGHTRYTVQLPIGGHGYVAFQATSPTAYTLFFEEGLALSLTPADALATSVSTATVPAACAGIHRRAEFSLPAGRSILELGPSPFGAAHYIVEISSGG